MTTEDGTNGLAGLFADDVVLLSRDKLEEMPNACIFAEDNLLVLDLTIDNNLGLDVEGNGNDVDAGCLEDADDESTELEIVDTHNEERGIKGANGTETLFGAEEYIEQLHVCKSALQILPEV